MNNELFFYGILHLGLSLFLSIFALYFTFTIITKYLRRKYEFSYDNIAFALFVGAIIFSAGYLLSSVTQPIMSTIRVLRSHHDATSNIYMDSAKYIGLFLFIGASGAAVINFVSVSLFMFLTKQINEFEELKKNNIAIGIITSIIIITVSLIAKDSLISIMEAFVPFPQVNF